MFSSCTVSSASKEIELGNSDQEASLSPDKNIRIVLVHVEHGSVSLQLFPRSSGVICYDTLVLGEDHKISSRIGVS